jgi:hypothetical protein
MSYLRQQLYTETGLSLQDRLEIVASAMRAAGIPIRLVPPPRAAAEFQPRWARRLVDVEG